MKVVRLTLVSAVALSTLSYAYAQTVAPPTLGNNAAPGAVENGGITPDNFNRRELREEMQQIRKEHEELEEAHEQLKAQCEHAVGAESASCEQQREKLKAWSQALHERRMALREKMQEMRNEHSVMDSGNDQNNGLPGRSPTFTPAPESSAPQPQNQIPPQPATDH